MFDHVSGNKLIKGGELILSAEDHDCGMIIENLSFNINFDPTPGEPKISWQQKGDLGLNLLIKGDTTSSLGTFFFLRNVGTLHGKTLNLALSVRGIGPSLQGHAKIVSYNFTLGEAR